MKEKDGPVIETEGHTKRWRESEMQREQETGRMRQGERQRE